MEKKKTKNFRSLSAKMMNYTVIPLFVLAVLVGIAGSIFCKRAMISMIEDEMTQECDYLEGRMDAMYPGDYSWVVGEGTSFTLYKGTYEITDASEQLDVLKESFNNDFSIYLGQVSVLTSCKDADGNRYLLAEAPTTVRKTVIEGGETRFYSNVTVAGEKCFAYFRPIVNAAGNSYGMYAIFHSAAQINRRVASVIIPLYILCFVTVVALGFFSAYFSQKIVERIVAVKRFTESVAGGKLDTDMSAVYTSGNDELAQLAKSSVQMQLSIRKMIDYDTLTEIHNRRFATGYITKLHDNAGVKADYCIAIGDIDYFKKVNDTYGHDAGDAVLKMTADVLRRNVPPGHLVARWGGEEFIFAFREMTPEEAYQILENCLAEIRKTAVSYEDKVISVTMSFGLAKATAGKSVDEILIDADAKLYDAKEGGRNRIVM